MPAIVLISVDLPAPLSPTSAITSPRRTSRSTSLRASTDPKVFVMPRSSRTGVSSGNEVRFLTQLGRPEAPQPRVTYRLAVLLVLPDADVALLEESGRVDLRPVRLVERNRRDDVRRLLLRAVRHRPGGRQLLSLDQLHGRLCGCLRAHARVLPDSHRLPATDDVLE